MNIGDREIEEDKLCRSYKRVIYLENEMTKSEQQTFRITPRVFAWKRVDEGPFMPVRVPLIVKKLARESRGKGAQATPESNGSADPLLTRSFRLDIHVFFFSSVPLQPLCRDSRIARKVSYIHVVIEPAFFPRARHTWEGIKLIEIDKNFVATGACHFLYAKITK